MTSPDESTRHVDPPESCEVAVGILTYNNVETIPGVLTAIRRGLAARLANASARLINADAGSSDGTGEVVAAAGLPVVRLAYDAPIAERTAVPFHGIPGRGAGLELLFNAAQRLSARVLVVLEADVISISEEWVASLARPVLDDKADLVLPAYARHRYDGTITNLVLVPLVRALYGRRLRQPFIGTAALSARLLERLLGHPRSPGSGRDVTDLWIVGAAIADGFGLWETWLGQRQVKSQARASGLPTLIAQTVGEVFRVMDRHPDFWLEARGSEPLPMLGEPILPSIEPTPVDVERMVQAFRLGIHELGSIWEHILAPDTLSDVLDLEVPATDGFRFPDDLWARVVYDFALGHHYGVVHRDHLLRSLVPLYLGRAAAFVLATRARDAAATEATLESMSLAFERGKSYLVEMWR